jgi:hypothetical protein
MGRVTPAGGVVLKFDDRSLQSLLATLKRADADLYREVRTTMRKEAQKIKRAQEQAVKSLSSKGGSRGSAGRSREATAAGITAENALTGTLSRTQARRASRATSLRSATARALAVEVRDRPSARMRTAGARIRMRASAMPADQRRLPKNMNRGRWRHPVFGDRDVWVSQYVSERGWFDATFDRMKDDAVRAIDAAVDSAFARLR